MPTWKVQLMNRFVAFGVLLVASALLLLIGGPLPAQEKKVAGKEPAPDVPPRKGKSEVIRLFNGKDLDGWEGHEKYWSVKDGVIIGKNSEEDAPKVSTYLLTKRKFIDFRLTFGGKLVTSEMHSGIAMWGQVFPEKG